MPRSATQQRLRGLSLGFRHTGCRVLDLRFRFLGRKITWSIWGVCAGRFLYPYLYIRVRTMGGYIRNSKGFIRLIGAEGIASCESPLDQILGS